MESVIENIRKNDPEQYKFLMKKKEEFQQMQLEQERQKMSIRERYQQKLNQFSSKRSSEHCNAMKQVKKDEWDKKEKEKEDKKLEQKKLQNKKRYERKKKAKKNSQVDKEFIEIESVQSE